MRVTWPQPVASVDSPPHPSFSKCRIASLFKQGTSTAQNDSKCFRSYLQQHSVCFKHLPCAEHRGGMALVCLQGALSLPLRTSPPCVSSRQWVCECLRKGARGPGVAFPNLCPSHTLLLLAVSFTYSSYIILLFLLLMKNIAFWNWLRLKRNFSLKQYIMFPEFTAPYFAVHCRINTYSV